MASICGIDFHMICELKYQRVPVVGEIKMCSYEIEIATEHEGNYSREFYETDFRDRKNARGVSYVKKSGDPINLHRIPNNFDELFSIQNIQAVILEYTNIETITSDDLSLFGPYIKYLAITKSQIKSIPEELFERNVNLVGVDFSDNQINFIHNYAFHGVTLKYLILKNNPCINRLPCVYNGRHCILSATSKNAVDTLIAYIFQEGTCKAV